RCALVDGLAGRVAGDDARGSWAAVVIPLEVGAVARLAVLHLLEHGRNQRRCAQKPRDLDVELAVIETGRRRRGDRPFAPGLGLANLLDDLAQTVGHHVPYVDGERFTSAGD